MKILKEGFAVLDDGKDDAMSRWCEREGKLCHDLGVQVHYLPHINRGDACVDAGAAIGDHTIAYIEKAGDSKLVHAFECNPLMLECLRYNCPGCHVYPNALSDKFERLWFHQCDANAGGGHVDLNEAGGVAVEAVPLDSFHLPKVDYIKWDIEGYEVKALRGARETILRCRPKMMIEVIPGAIERAGDTVEQLYQELIATRYTWRAVLGVIDVRPYFELFCEPLP